MKKKMKYKKSLVLFISVLFFLFSLSFVVKAVDGLVSQPDNSGVAVGDLKPLDEGDNGTCEYIEENMETFINRYGADISYDEGSHNLVVRLLKEKADSSIKASADAVKFKVTEVVVTDYDSNTGDPKKKNQVVTSGEGAVASAYIVSQSKVLTFDNEIRINNGNTGYVGYDIKIEPDGFYDKLIGKNCGENSSFYVILTYDYGGGAIVETERDAPVYDYPSVNADIFSCSGYTDWDPDTFAYKYCDDKAKAEKVIAIPTDFSDTGSYSQLMKKIGGEESVKYYCNKFNIFNNSVAKTLREPGYHYVNKDYLMGVSTNEKTLSYSYVYNYGGMDDNGVGAKKKVVPIKCKTKCTEIVTVEYGVPMATTAGLCFEYNIKVTSRVNCDMIMGPNPPVPHYSYCTPTPQCVHKNGGVRYAAGPDEDFDKCINHCDGGKYTDKCVDSCYQEVYEEQSNTNNPLSFYSDSSIYAKKIVNTYDNNTMDRGFNCDGKGKYRWSGNKIIWTPARCYGRFYQFHPDSIGYHECTKTVDEGGGISSDCGCSAVCEWTGCSEEQYLNPGEAKKDNDDNNTAYQKALDECKAREICNTTTATFSMDVVLNDYDKSGNDVVVHLPFEKNAVKENEISFGAESKTVSCPAFYGSTLISTDGCYKCNSNYETSKDSNLYSTVLGFPGTWINNKSGEISYVPQANTWTEYTRKFCTPLDIKNTNYDWWLYYYYNKYKDDPRFAFNDEDYLENAYCSDGSKGVIAYFPAIPEKNKIAIDYNIIGKIRHFGYFGWNVDVSCFYASGKLDGGSCSGEQVQRVRSVDLKNLFPSEDGTKLSSPDTSGRSPGFNWSSHATNLVKDTNYQSSPSEYMRWVQNKEYQVYSDDYLDYEVILTREKIRELKDPNYNYANFSDNTNNYTVDSVINYKSNLFRGSNPMFPRSSGNLFPNEEALKCNNMENHDSTRCQDLSR